MSAKPVSSNRRNTVFHGGFLRLVLMCCLAMSLSPGAQAAIIEKLYEVEIFVADQSKPVRDKAFGEGLADVLVRISGDQYIFSIVKRPYAPPYVKQYRYRDLTDEERTMLELDRQGVQSTANPQVLWIQYNETKITEFVKQSALPVWGRHRPEVVLWIAVHDGVNRYVLRDVDRSLIKTVIDDTAELRGVPVHWPRIDPLERSIRFADVWAGFRKPIQDLSSAITDGPILIGRMRWDGEGWSSDWELSISDDIHEWQKDDADYRTLLESAINTAGDRLGSQFAMFDSGSQESFHALDIRIEEIGSILELRSIREYLDEIPFVQEHRMMELEGQRADFRLALKTSTDDFLSYIKTDAMLQPIEEVSEPSVPGALPFGGSREDGITYRFRSLR